VGDSVSEKSGTMQMCPHCGATEVRRLGGCSVCDKTVCEHCGNVHIVQGERKATHAECLHRDMESFSMIRFVD